MQKGGGQYKCLRFLRHTAFARGYFPCSHCGLCYLLFHIKMEETRQKFRDDWSTLFPDNLIPDTSFLDSKEAVNNKLSSLEETVHNLRKQLQ